MKIALVNAKGGCGRTTSAMYLATAAYRDGYDVEVWDTAPQASAIAWHALSKGAVSFPVIKPSQVAISEKEDVGKVVIIDTPRDVDKTVEEVLSAADLAVVPMTASLSDMLETRKFLNWAKNTPTKVLLTSPTPRANAPVLFKEAFIEEGVPAFSSMISTREDIRNSFAQSPHKLYEYQFVWEEIKQDVYHCLDR